LGLGARPSLAGVRFAFDRTPTGAIYLANVRLSKRSGAEADAGAAEAEASAPPATDGGSVAAEGGEGGRAPVDAAIVAIRPASRRGAPASGRPGGSTGVVEIEIAASGPMPVTDALPVLTIAGRRFTRGGFGPGRTDRILFTLDGPAFAALPDGAEAELRLGLAHRLRLGAFDRSMLRR
jgi:hypothetical protein